MMANEIERDLGGQGARCGLGSATWTVRVHVNSYAPAVMKKITGHAAR
jgi:hypothetical protein